MTDISRQISSRSAGESTLRNLAPWVIASLFLLFMPVLFSSNSAITIMNQMAITIVFALGYNMLLGQAGMLSFGHAVYMGMGGFACVHLMNYVSDNAVPLPLPLLPIFGGMVGMSLALIVGSFSTRSTGTIFAMISLGVGELIAACSIIFVAFFGGEEGVSGYRDEGLPVFGVDFAQQIEVYYLIVVWMMIAAGAMYLFSRTPLGRMANAVRDNPERVEFLGYSAQRVRLYSFVASGFFVGIAGGLSAINFEIITEENLNLMQSGSVLLVTFLGGIGHFIGPIIGAVVFTLLSTLLSVLTELWQLYVGAIFVLAVLFFPGGLAGVLMMHAPALKLGKLSRLVVPYIKTLVPAAVGIFGLIGLVETTFHFREASPGDTQMSLYFTTFDTHSFLPWIVLIAMTAGGGYLARQFAPEMVEAFETASEPEESDT